jgi:hypothetical protein
LSEPGRADQNSADLTPASRRQDHTTSPSAKASLVRARSAIAHGFNRIRPAIPSRARRYRVHRIPPRVRDDREPPLCGTGRESSRCDLGCAGREIFLRTGLDRKIRFAPDGQINGRRIGRPGRLGDRRMQTSQPRGMNDAEQDELDHQGSVERQALNADVSEGDENSSVRSAAVGVASVIVDFSCLGALPVRPVCVIVGEQSRPIPAPRSATSILSQWSRRP